ncbi:hypothetical protein [Streptomyces avermitilis]|uniref:hypothetical protein n=1 Tax=Streptomyces avermitilis TaxID=33903 RepID=UPI003827002A
MFGSKKTPAERAQATHLRNLRLAAGAFGIRVSDGHFKAFGQQDVPVEGATVAYETGEASKRLTATRVALIGPFALLAKKDNSKMFLTILGADGSGIVMEVPAAKEVTARQLQALLSPIGKES